MQVIGPGLVTEICYSAAGLPVLCGIIRGLHFEFADGVGPGTEFVEAAAAEVVSPDSDAVYQNFMAEELASVDGTRKGIAYSSGKTRKDKSLKLPSPITNFNRQGLKFLGAH